MTRNLHHALVLSSAIMLGAFTAGCNIFDFASDAEQTNVEQAEDNIREGDYDAARELLADAVKDSTDSHALYLDAKAQLRKAGVDIVEIAELVEGQDASSGDQLGLLEVIDGLSDAEQTAWYQANLNISANLRKIFNQETTGPFKPEDIALEYTISNLMSGVLGLRDTNGDKVIDDNDFSLDVLFNGAGDGYAITGGSYEDELGNLQSFTGLEVFLGSFAAKTATPGVTTGKAGYEPDDINRLILHVMYLLDNSRDALKVLIQKNLSTFDPNEIDNYVTQIASLVNYYWYDDGIDTDGDGRIDEETINGLDDDGDGFIDEDSKYHPVDPTNTRNTQYYQTWLKWKNR
jgi:hypothetical protein